MASVKFCADCGTKIGRDNGRPDGIKLEDGRIVCYSCCVVDSKKTIKAPVFIESTRLDVIGANKCQINLPYKRAY